MNRSFVNANDVNSRRDHILAIIKKERQLPHSSSHLHVVRSWERCLDHFKLDPDKPIRPMVLDEFELKSRCSQYDSFLSVAQFEIENLYEQVAGSGSAVMVVDKEGYVLKHLGDKEFSEASYKKGLHVGANWSESVQGTNAMGTCLAERQPSLIHHTEHFFFRNTNLTCAAAPIFDPQGELLGVLDVSSSSSLAQQHTSILVNMAAQMIENRVFINQYYNSYTLRFHSRPEFINTLGEGIISFNDAGRVTALNRCARQQLGKKDMVTMGNCSVEDLFDATQDELLQFAERQSMYPAEIRCAQNGRRFYAIAQPPATLSRTKILHFKNTDQHKKATCHNSASPLIDTPLIDTLEFGDDATRIGIERAKKVINITHLPITISGETGTGKGLLAKALHRYSDRADKPLVSINCAAIPESLLESELFGYVAGTFTGAKRSGSLGKIRAADGGILFLDEIGDMPPHLQTSLLQVLEDSEVIPLGSSTPIPVDIRLISATHQDLNKLVQSQDFREDLLYRLQGLNVHLPPLRDRADLQTLAEQFLNEETTNPLVLSDEAQNTIMSYSWPGNIRQLRKVMQTTRIFSSSNIIFASDLPEELGHLPTTTQPHNNSNHHLQQTHHNTTGRLLSPLELLESEAIENALLNYSWCVTRAAKNLNLSRTTMYRKIKKYGFESHK